MIYEFNKKILFDNITYILKEKGMGVGEFEELAGVSTGFCARSRKDEKSKPGIDFIMKVSGILGVGIDALLMIDFTALTPTEKYLMGFLDKLNRDTLDDKLNWNVETPDDLQGDSPNAGKRLRNPLYVHTMVPYPSTNNHLTDTVKAIFNSLNYGHETDIADNCFNLQLDGNTSLYLMNVCESSLDEPTGTGGTLEVWIYTENEEPQFLGDNSEGKPLAPLIDNLYSSVTENYRHPKIKSFYRNAIDAFMSDGGTE